MASSGTASTEIAPPLTSSPTPPLRHGSGAEKGSSPSTTDFQTNTIPPWRFWMLSVGVCLGLFLSIIDSSIVATSLYTIGLDFEAIESANWVALAYTLAYLGCAVTFARLSDVIGRRDAFVAAFVIFLAFSLGCGFAQNLNQLIAFRAVQGIGGSGLYSLSMIILPELAPPSLRKYIGGIIGMVIAGSGVMGPVLGGILTHYVTWRWVFWINGPIGLVSMAIFFLSWPHAKYLPTIHRHPWGSFDVVGTILLIAAAVLVVFAFQNAGESSEPVWDRAVFIAPLVCGLWSWLALFAWEYLVDLRLRHRLAPTFPISLFRNRAYTAGAASTLFIGYPYLLIIFSFPTRAQVVSGKSALIGGVMLLPMLGTTAFGSAMAGKINSNRNYLFETLLTGACLMLLGCGLLSTVGGSEDDAKAIGFLAFAGLGFGLSTAAATILATVEAPMRDHAPAHGILAQMRILGGSLGISASTVLLDHEVTKYLSGLLSPEEQATLGGGQAHLSAEQRTAVHLAYSEAFRKGMISALAVSAIGVVATLGGYRRKRMMIEDQRQALMQEELSERSVRHVSTGKEAGNLA